MCLQRSRLPAGIGKVEESGVKFLLHMFTTPPPSSFWAVLGEFHTRHLFYLRLSLQMGY